MTIVAKTDIAKDLQKLQEYIEQELSVMEVIYSTDTEMVQLKGVLNFKELGKKVGKDMKKVQEAAKQLSQDDLRKFDTEGTISIAGHEIDGDGLQVVRELKDLGNPNLDVAWDRDLLVVLDFTPDPDLQDISVCRGIARGVQKLRKDAKLQPDDPVDMWVEVRTGQKGTGTLERVLREKMDVIQEQLRRPLLLSSQMQGGEV